MDEKHNREGGEASFPYPLPTPSNPKSEKVCLANNHQLVTLNSLFIIQRSTVSKMGGELGEIGDIKLSPSNKQP